MDESELSRAASSTGGNMTDSCLTASSDDGNVSDDNRNEGSDGFWPLVAQDLRSLYSSVSCTAGGAVRFLQKSALSVAAEIAELERQEGALKFERLRLPWEVSDADDAEIILENEELKAELLLVSHQASNFLGPFTVAGDFDLDDARIQLIRDLLEIDPVLAKTHARLSSRTSTTEALFWRNYFHHCQAIQDKYLFPQQDGQEDFDDADKKEEGNSILSGDDASYVCVDGSLAERPPSRPPSAPSSWNMISRSTGDLIILGTPDDIPKSPVAPPLSPVQPIDRVASKN
ncbi:hypothetical protein MPSEU_000145200 [Mayamaea pseudoterrestris]|nr:hypothetical protein MPSEU_000145200 [Mayamaea pseudoterrestris]